MSPPIPTAGKFSALERSDVATKSVDIWLLNMAGGNPSRLTFVNYGAGNPLWSPDSQRVLFTLSLLNVIDRKARPWLQMSRAETGDRFCAGWSLFASGNAANASVEQAAMRHSARVELWVDASMVAFRGSVDERLGETWDVEVLK